MASPLIGRLCVPACLLTLLLLGACVTPVPSASNQLMPSIPASEQPTASPTATVEQTGSGQSAANDKVGEQESYHGIPVGFTAAGYPYRGKPDAPITVFEFSDFQCPFCSRHVIQTEPALLEQYVRPGRALFVFRDFPLAELHPNAPAAHNAALCVADQGAADFWNMHDQLFRTQEQWASLSDPTEFFAGLAQAVGVDMDRYGACVAGGEKKTIIEKGLGDGRTLGISGTPSFQFKDTGSTESFTLVGAQPYDTFATWLDTLAAGGRPTEAQAAQQPESQGIPVWATAEGLKPDPDQPGYTMSGDEYRGNATDPKLVVIEFSDFECPYCQRHVSETQPILDEKFVDTGQIMWVFKHFPLDIHPHAPLAGAAAECAADQGQFWQMHDLLFKTVSSWAVSDEQTALEGLAQQLGLDVDQFSACLEQGDAAARVQADLTDGGPFVRGTPTFIVLQGGQGRIIPGALPADQFVTALQGLLDEAGGKSGSNGG